VAEDWDPKCVPLWQLECVDIRIVVYWSFLQELARELYIFGSSRKQTFGEIKLRGATYEPQERSRLQKS
jgi:hypothetical protein